MARLYDGWCAALDRNDMTCMIYENRPKICHDFEMGGYECLAERRFARSFERARLNLIVR